MPPKAQKIFLPEAPPVQQADPRGHLPIQVEGGNRKTSIGEKGQLRESPTTSEESTSTIPDNLGQERIRSDEMADCETHTPLREHSSTKDKPGKTAVGSPDSSMPLNPTTAPNEGSEWLLFLIFGGIVFAIAIVCKLSFDSGIGNDQAASRSPNYTTPSNIPIPDPVSATASSAPLSHTATPFAVPDDAGYLALAGKVEGEKKTIEVMPGVNMPFCWCPRGNFMMGSPPTEKGRHDDEGQVLVHITKGFWIAQTEVTQAQWEALMGTTPEQQKMMGNSFGELAGLGADHPMCFVSWEDAQQLIYKLNQKLLKVAGWRYTLPTEAQWEYACRAGIESAFAFGESLTSQQASISGQQTCRVGSFRPNAWNICDMHGNVSEWCRDWYLGGLSGGSDPEGPTMGVNHVYRGGSWFHSAYASRSASRDGRRQLYRFNNLGFRPALVVSPTLVETNPGPPISQTILPKSPAQIVSAPVSKPIDQPPPIRQTTVPSPSVTTVVPPKPPITSHESESVKRNYSSVPNPRPPFQTVKVINVKMNDSLALREGPSSQSRKLGNIPYNATGIELLNDSRTNGRDHWFAVVWQGIRGWVNGSYVIYD